MSAPAAKTLGPPYRTTARIPSSAATCSAVWASSSLSWAFSAFIGGRSSRIVATASSVSTRTNSLMTGLLLSQVAVGHPDRRLGHRDQSELGPGGQQRMAGQHPHCIAERA